MPELWDYFVQTTHRGTVVLEGDTAPGRAYVCEFGQMRDGRSEPIYALYHDRYRRTPSGWKFIDRVFEVRYLDTTPLAARRQPPRTRPADPLGMPSQLLHTAAARGMRPAGTACGWSSNYRGMPHLLAPMSCIR